MSFVSKLVQAGVKEVGEKTAKFLNQMPAADIAGAVQAVTKHPNEFADYLRHADNYANKGDQSGILPMIQMSNKWSVYISIIVVSGFFVWLLITNGNFN